MSYPGHFEASAAGAVDFEVDTYGGDVLFTNLDTGMGLSYLMVSLDADPVNEAGAAFIVTGTMVIPNCNQRAKLHFYVRRSKPLAFFAGPFNRYPL